MPKAGTGKHARIILAASSGLLPVTEMPSGDWVQRSLSTWIFPASCLQAGRRPSDLMVVPENEYPEIDPMHSRMALYRGVEEGFNLLLHASQSLSLACDYQGRVYGLMDHYRATARVLVAQLPSNGVRTIYSRSGYLFPWVCILGLSLLLFVRFLPTRIRRIQYAVGLDPVNFQLARHSGGMAVTPEKHTPQESEAWFSIYSEFAITTETLPRYRLPIRGTSLGVLQ